MQPSDVTISAADNLCGVFAIVKFRINQSGGKILNKPGIKIVLYQQADFAKTILQQQIFIKPCLITFTTCFKTAQMTFLPYVNKRKACTGQEDQTFFLRLYYNTVLCEIKLIGSRDWWKAR